MEERVAKLTSSGLSLTKVICISSATTAIIIIAIKHSISANIVYIFHQYIGTYFGKEVVTKISFGS